MDTRTGEIHYLDSEELKEIESRIENRSYSEEQKLVELSEDEVKKCATMPNYQRKGWMRNKPCICGSGKKFKKCCWSKFNE